MRGEKLIADVYAKTQNKKYLIGIWWYQIRTGILEYSKEAQGHLDDRYFSLHKLASADKSIIRGRLIKDRGVVYLVVFSEGSERISEAALMDLKSKLKDKALKEIDFVVDYEGVSLLEAFKDLEEKLRNAE